MEMGYKCNKARRFGTEIFGDVTLPGVMVYFEGIFQYFQERSVERSVNISNCESLRGGSSGEAHQVRRAGTQTVMNCEHRELLREGVRDRKTYNRDTARVYICRIICRTNYYIMISWYVDMSLM